MKNNEAFKNQGYVTKSVYKDQEFKRKDQQFKKLETKIKSKAGFLNISNNN